MNPSSLNQRNRDGKSPTRLSLIRNPLDFLAEDHLRLRYMCAEMDRLANAPEADEGRLAALTEYLTQELPLLRDDEYLDVLPCVLTRAEPEDELAKLALRLQTEHQTISGYLRVVTTGLESLASEAPLPEDLKGALRALANATRRHLILKNAVLLPLSRARLTQADLRVLRNAMLKRRGLHHLFCAPPDPGPD